MSVPGRPAPWPMSVPHRTRSPRIRFGVADGLLFGVVGWLTIADVGSSIARGNWGTYPALAITYYPALVAMVAAGGVSFRREGQRGNGRLLLAIAGSSALTDILTSWPDIGPSIFLSNLVSAVLPALFGHLLLRWPDHRLASRRQVVLVAIAYVAPVLVALGWQVLWLPRWFDPRDASWTWLTIAPNRAVAVRLDVAGQYLNLALIAAFIVFIAAKIVRADAARRRRLVPVAIAAVFIAATAIVSAANGIGIAIPVDTNLLSNLGTLAVPLAVLIGDARLVRDATGGDRAALGPQIAVIVAAALVVASALTVGLTALAAAPAGGIPNPQPGPVASPVIGQPAP